MENQDLGKFNVSAFKQFIEETPTSDNGWKPIYDGEITKGYTGSS